MQEVAIEQIAAPDAKTLRVYVAGELKPLHLSSNNSRFLSSHKFVDM